MSSKPLDIAKSGKSNISFIYNKYHHYLYDFLLHLRNLVLTQTDIFIFFKTAKCIVIENCQVGHDGMENDHNCFIVQGRFAIFVSDYNVLLDTIQTDIVHSIKSIMDKDLLNNCRPAKNGVAFIYDTDIGLDVADFDDENDGAENDTITILIGGQTSWIAIGMGVSIFVVIVVRHSVSKWLVPIPIPIPIPINTR